MTNGIYTYYDVKKCKVVYVGRDSRIDKMERHKAHMSKSKFNAQPFNRILQNNPDRYHYSVLKEGNYDNDTLNAMEMYYIDIYNTYHYDNEDGLNFTLGGDGVSGYNHTPESIAKISKANKGNKHTPESIAKMSEAKKGNKHTPESIAKMSEAKKGEKNHNWKNYARVLKNGYNASGNQQYVLKHNGKKLKVSVNKDKLQKEADDINKRGEL